ncbi:hypothetical protein TNCV_4084601 [Trichonephila clavipes]|nr:hypothetical protein TNCV_4084601 [Trichonephila clavipes]
MTEYSIRYLNSLSFHVERVIKSNILHGREFQFRQNPIIEIVDVVDINGKVAMKNIGFLQLGSAIRQMTDPKQALSSLIAAGQKLPSYRRMQVTIVRS